MSTDQDRNGRVQPLCGWWSRAWQLVLIGGDWYREVHLLLQVSTAFSSGHRFYVSGEESAEQIKLRAERLGDIDSEFYLYAETNMQISAQRLRKSSQIF